MPPRRSARVASLDTPDGKRPKYAESSGSESESDEFEDEAVSESESEVEEEEDEQPELEVGDHIPEIVLLDENETEVNLAEVAKKNKYVVIFAYPKASTPGCTRQVLGFQENYLKLQASNAAVYGLSADTPSSQLNFVSKQGLKYPLLSDPERELIGLLGAKKIPTGIKRSHWIFVDGILEVKKVQISPEVSVDSALADIQKMEGVDGKAAEKEEPKEEAKEEAKEEPKTE